VLESLSDQCIDHLSTKIIGFPDKYIEQGPQDFLRVQYGLTADGIYEQTKDLWLSADVRVGERF